MWKNFFSVAVRVFFAVFADGKMGKKISCGDNLRRNRVLIGGDPQNIQRL